MARGGRSQVSRPRLVRAVAAPAVTGSLAATLPALTGSRAGSFVPSGTLTNDGTYIYTHEAVDSNTLLADDFSRGEWFRTYCSPGTAANIGWNGTPFPPSGEKSCGTTVDDPGGTYFGRPGQGIGGGNCVGNGGHGGIGQAYGMALHNLKATTTELWWRYYVKPLSGYTFGQEKGLTFNKFGADSGIYFGTLFYGSGVGSTCTPMFYAINQGENLYQNQGNNLVMSGGSWYYVEIHLKLNGNGSDVVEMWMDNCGSAGTSGPSTPTLRLRYTNAQLRPGGDSTSPFGSVWIENWANPAASGEMYYDQIKVSSAGAVGPATVFN